MGMSSGWTVIAALGGTAAIIWFFTWVVGRGVRAQASQTNRRTAVVGGSDGSAILIAAGAPSTDHSCVSFDAGSGDAGGHH